MNVQHHAASSRSAGHAVHGMPGAGQALFGAEADGAMGVGTGAGVFAALMAGLQALSGEPAAAQADAEGASLADEGLADEDIDTSCTRPQDAEADGRMAWMLGLLPQGPRLQGAAQGADASRGGAVAAQGLEGPGSRQGRTSPGGLRHDAGAAMADAGDGGEVGRSFPDRAEGLSNAAEPRDAGDAAQRMTSRRAAASAASVAGTQRLAAQEAANEAANEAAAMNAQAGAERAAAASGAQPAPSMAGAGGPDAVAGMGGLNGAAGAGGAPGLVPATARPAEAPMDLQLSTPVDHEDFPIALGLQISALVREGVHEARMQLNPLELGPITVEIALDGREAQVHFAADHAHAREALRESLETLSRALQADGFSLAGSSVGEGRGQGAQAQGEGRREGAGRPLAGALGRAAGAAAQALAGQAAGGLTAGSGTGRGAVDLYA